MRRQFSWGWGNAVVARRNGSNIPLRFEVVAKSRVEAGRIVRGVVVFRQIGAAVIRSVFAAVVRRPEVRRPFEIGCPLSERGQPPGGGRCADVRQVGGLR